ncbi:hypothetical protein GCG54_00012275, partial [Colletotrichum gloeosporioides]
FPSTPSATETTLKDILRSRQRMQNGVRGNPKSCLPCRERKVKCDKGRPCLTCSKRGHADLCSYEPRTSLGARSPIRSRTLHPPTRSPGSDRNRHDVTSFSTSDAYQDHVNASPGPSTAASPNPSGSSSHGTAVANNGDTTFLADNSVVNMARQRSPRSRDDPARQSAFETGILPLLGISDDTASSAMSFSSLPSDQEIVRLFEVFRQRAHPFHVITYNLDHIEARACALVTSGRVAVSECPEDPWWLCLLHAILATGAQFSELSFHKRLALSQQHTKHAFDLLRCTDYLAKPTKEAIQTLLLLGNVLQNDMKPQAAWVLGGTTIRLAQCLGIHKKPDRLVPALIPPEEAKYLRLAIVWQDALLALAFGRPPASHEMDFEEDLPPLTNPPINGKISYLEAMNWLCHVTLRHVSSREGLPSQPLAMLDDLRSVEISLSPHLTDPQKGKSIRKLQEFYAFELHKNFVVSTLCRPFISSSSSRQVNDADRSVILEQFRDSLRRSVRAYVRLRTITGHARRSWAFIHNGLTSVLLLSLMRETRYLPETRTLQDEMITSLSDSDPDSMSDSSGHLSETLKKALKALQTLQRLADSDLTSRGRNVDAVNTNDPPPENNSGQNPDQQGDQDSFWNMGADDWSFPFNFDMSPLGAFDYIMSDQSFSGDSFLPII